MLPTANGVNLYRTLPDLNLPATPTANQAQTSASALADSGSFQASSLAEFTISHGWMDLSIQDSQTSLAYRKDNSLALSVSSQFNLSMHTEETDIGVTLPAESLGLTQSSFPQGKSLQFSFSWEQLTGQIDYSYKAQTVQTTRSAQDILSDLTNILQKIFKDKGDKTIFLTMDKEAIQALMSDSQVKGVMNEIAGLLTIINSMRLQGGPRQRYMIQLSGKGQPYEDVQEKTSVQANLNKITFTLTIQPPQASQDTGTSDQPAQPAVIAQSTPEK